MILGLDFSGVVAAVGSSASGFQVGDEVLGRVPLGGAYAQYLVVRPSDSRTAIAHKPKGISHERAGVVPFAALVALPGLELAIDEIMGDVPAAARKLQQGTMDSRTETGDGFAGEDQAEWRSACSICWRKATLWHQNRIQ